MSESGVPVRERIAALDVLRGVAVAGILFANVLVFFGIFSLPPERAAPLTSATIDRAAQFAERIFVEGKFYSIFSLLFGVGFGIQLARGEDAAIPRFKRRLRILLAIGVVHAVFIWAGDILMLYALLGFSMPWFARKTNRELLRWTLVMLAIPASLYLLAVVAFGLLAPTPSAAAAENRFPPEILRIFEAVGTGGIWEAFIGNLMLLVGRWIDLIITMRFPKVLGMFVLGLWLVRSGIALSPASHRPLLVKWMMLGWGIGLPANILSVWAFEQWQYLPPSIGGWLGVIMQAIGFPLLALGYAATITLIVVDGRRVLNMFAPVGRMALTNYLMHSLICVILSYGFGFGLWWQTRISTMMAIAAAIIVVQIPLSALWMSRYRFGPVEWVWRRLTYRGPI